MQNAGATKRPYQHHQRKRLNPNARERTVTELVPSNTDGSQLVPSPSEQAPFALPLPFNMHHQQGTSLPPLPPPAVPVSGKNDLDVLERLKARIKSGNHETYVPIPNPAALQGLYLGPDDVRVSPSLKKNVAQVIRRVKGQKRLPMESNLPYRPSP